MKTKCELLENESMIYIKRKDYVTLFRAGTLICIFDRTKIKELFIQYQLLFEILCQ